MILLLLKETKNLVIIAIVVMGWFCCYWNKNLVIIASGHWKRKNGLLARAVQVVVDCPKMAALEKTTLSISIYDTKKYFSIHLPWQLLCGVVVDLQLQKNTPNLDKPSIIFWSRWVVLCPIVLSWVTHDQGNHVCVMKVEIVGSSVVFGGIYFCVW